MSEQPDRIVIAANEIREAVLAGDRSRATSLLRDADLAVIQWLHLTWTATGLDLLELVAPEHMDRLTADS